MTKKNANCQVRPVVYNVGDTSLSGVVFCSGEFYTFIAVKEYNFMALNHEIVTFIWLS